MADELGIDVHDLVETDEHHALAAMLATVWHGPGGDPPYSSDLFTALSHCGGWVAGAVQRDSRPPVVVAGGFGFLAPGRRLHSHVVAVHPDFQDRGLGTALKVHQYAWAAGHGLDLVTWTFDPLLRRNAWFNVAKLGARVVAYAEDYYGELHDGVNDGEQTDRALVEWYVGDKPPVVEGETREVGTPDDIATLRRTNAPAARDWRQYQRDRLPRLFLDGWVVTSFTRDGDYVLQHLA